MLWLGLELPFSFMVVEQVPFFHDGMCVRAVDLTGWVSSESTSADHLLRRRIGKATAIHSLVESTALLGEVRFCSSHFCILEFHWSSSCGTFYSRSRCRSNKVPWRISSCAYCRPQVQFLLGRSLRTAPNAASCCHFR
jgi:hypothetical protein